MFFTLERKNYQTKCTALFLKRNVIGLLKGQEGAGGKPDGVFHAFDNLGATKFLVLWGFARGVTTPPVITVARNENTDWTLAEI